jgi:hypothetical protein
LTWGSYRQRSITEHDLVAMRMHASGSKKFWTVHRLSRVE